MVPVEWVSLIYPFQRILLVMAHVSAIILLYKSRYAQPLFRRLEAVGQMALTNYIMHSVICTLVFFGYGLNYFAELEFYQIYFVVLAIWVLAIDRQPGVAEVFPLRTARMGLAELDILAAPTLQAAR